MRSLSRIVLTLLSSQLPYTTLAQQDQVRICNGTWQTCGVADLSGSSGRAFDVNAQPRLNGKTPSGILCIDKIRTSWGLPPSEPGYPLTLEGGLLTTNEQVPKIRQVPTCKPYTLLFARATGEFGSMGLSVGPALQYNLNSAMPGRWDFKGIEYDNGQTGNDCVGLPGGMICLSVLNQTARVCPDTQIIVGGYSQGAMVAHNCVGYASEDVKKQVKGVVLFGDPMGGAPIKGFPNERIRSYCQKGDTICDGYEVAPVSAHFLYVGVDTTDAVKWMQQAVKS